MEKEELIRFAVYGTLKSGYGNNRLLENAKFVGMHVTEPEYTMYHSGFPIVCEGGTTAITCEIWETTDPTVEGHVNSLEGFSGIKKSSHNWYDRKTIQTKYGPAEMFVMYGKKELKIIPSGIWSR